MAIDGSPSRSALTTSAACRRGCRASQDMRTCGTWLATSGTNTSALTPGPITALLRIVFGSLVELTALAFVILLE